MQTGVYETEEQAATSLMRSQDLLKDVSRSWWLVLLRGLPFGALQCSLYDFCHELSG